MPTGPRNLAKTRERAHCVPGAGEHAHSEVLVAVATRNSYETVRPGGGEAGVRLFSSAVWGLEKRGC